MRLYSIIAAWIRSSRLDAYLDSLGSRPVAELNRAQRGLRFLVDLTRHAGRELRTNDAGEMAAALTYRTIFGLVPLLMVSMLAFRLFVNMEDAARELREAAYGFFNYQVDETRPEAAAFKLALDDKVLDVVQHRQRAQLRDDRRRRRAAADLGGDRPARLAGERRQPHLPRATGPQLVHARRHLLDRADARPAAAARGALRGEVLALTGECVCRCWARCSPCSASSARWRAASWR